METDALKIFTQWLKNETEAIRETFGGSSDPFSRGVRSELRSVVKALKAAKEGKLHDNG